MGKSSDDGYIVACSRSKRMSHESSLQHNPELYCTLGSRLRHIRSHLVLSQGSMADVLGTTQNIVSQWESDEVIPNWYVLVCYAVAFGMTLDSLLDGVAPTPKTVSKNMHHITLPGRNTDGYYL